MLPRIEEKILKKKIKKKTILVKPYRMKGLKNTKKKRLKFLNNYQFLYKNKYLRSSKNKKETP